MRKARRLIQCTCGAINSPTRKRCKECNHPLKGMATVSRLLLSAAAEARGLKRRPSEGNGQTSVPVLNKGGETSSQQQPGTTA